MTDSSGSLRPLVAAAARTPWPCSAHPVTPPTASSSAVREGGAEVLDSDVVGRLWRREIDPPRRWIGRREEPVVMVEVQNSTPEPDGTRKTYYLRVPPNLRTAREAVAWTFGLSGSQYRPERET